MTRDFIWKGNSGKGIHLVGWKTITKPKSEGGLAIRRAREANTAMLGKLVWDLQQRPNKLWVSVLHSKYKTKGSFISSPKVQGSFIWNSIHKAKLVLKDGFEFRIGDGTSSFWYSDWTPFGRLSSQVLYVDIHDTHLCLKDIFDGNHWNLDILYTLLPLEIQNYITSLAPTLCSGVEDCVVWKDTLEGSYSANAGYKWLIKQINPTIPSPLSWNWIWKSALPEKIKILIWCLCHDSLPTASMLNRRGMLPNTLCQRCKSAEEDCFHLFRDCPTSKRLWLYFGFNNISFFTATSMHNWLLSGVSGTSPSTFAAAVWWIWRQRNSIVIANEDFPYHRLTLEVSKLASLIAKVLYSQQKNSPPPRMVAWHPSKEDCIILNVDGSSFGNPGPAGFGGLIRRNDGTWIVGFAGSLGESNNLHAELMAIYKGLCLAWEIGVRQLICYTDSLHSVSLIKEQATGFHHYASIIQNIRDTLGLQWNVQLIHCLREGNSAADFIAKLGVQSHCHWSTFEDPPSGIEAILVADASRSLSMRM